jgi:hypothetical protein
MLKIFKLHMNLTPQITCSPEIYLVLTLSVRVEYIYSMASQATSPGGVYILRDLHKVVK